jgi:hypothetical protein
MTTLEMQANGGEFLIEAAKDVDDECVVGDEFTQVDESVSHGLEALAALGDEQVALNEVPKLGIEVESPGFPVVEKMSLDSKAGGTSSGAALHDNLNEVSGDHAE